MRSRSLIGRWSIVIGVATIAMMGLSRVAYSQGTDNLFPDPMTFNELTEYIALLDLSPGQRQLIRDAHRDYLLEHRRLRDSEIDAYLKGITTLPLSYVNDREQLDLGTRRMRSILNRAERIDASFFENLDDHLSDTQVAQLRRVAERRHRKRLSSTHGIRTGGLPSLETMDLSRILRAVQLSPAESAGLAEILASYESAATPIFYRVHGAWLDWPLAMHERFAEARRVADEDIKGIREQLGGRGANPQALNQALEDIDIHLASVRNPAASDDPVAEKLRNELSRLSRLNRQTLELIRKVVSAESMHAIESRYFSSALSMVNAPADELWPAVRATLEDDEVATHIREGLRILYETYSANRWQLLDRLLIHAERHGFESDESIVVQLESLNRESLESSAALVGHPREVAIEVEADSMMWIATTRRLTAVQGLISFNGDVQTWLPMVSTGPRIAGWLPGPIQQTDYSAALSTLGVEDEHVPITDVMYTDYLASFKLLETSKLLAIRKRIEDISNMDTDDPAAGQEIDRAFRSVRGAMEEILALDRSLLEGALPVASDDSARQRMARAMHPRTWRAYSHLGQGARATNFVGGGFESNEHDVDLVALVNDGVPAKEMSAEIILLLDEYSKAMLELRRNRWLEELDLAAFQFTRKREMLIDGNADVRTAMIEMDKAGDSAPARRLRGILKQMRDVNRRTLESFQSLLAPEPSYSLMRSYREGAFPSAFGDGESLHDLFVQIDGHDLTSVERGRVREVLLSYRAEYDEVTDRMIKIIRDVADHPAMAGGKNDENPLQTYFSRTHFAKKQLEVEQFARRNVNQRYRQQLSDILSPALLAELGLSSAHRR